MKFILEVDLEIDDLHKPERLIAQLLSAGDVIRNATGCDPFANPPVPPGAVRDIRARVGGVLFAGFSRRFEDGRQAAYYAVVDEPFEQHELEGPVRSQRDENGDWHEVKTH